MANGLWVDPRREIWLWPISSMIILCVTGLLIYSVYAIYQEDPGELVAKKRFMLISFSLLVAGLIYTCIGIYQVFAHEIRKLFIVRKVELFGDHLELRGYYFKQDTFAPDDIERIDEHSVSRRFGKNIATALSHRRHNYKITLKDGREFYLPGEMTDVDELKSLLASKLSKPD